MALRKLTSKQRILLHLFDFTRYADEFEVPLEVSQSGIASAVGIRVHHATQYLRPLIDEGSVEEGVRHIQKQARRRKTYFLTPQGRREGSALRTSLFEESVAYRHRSGREETLTVAQVYQEERRGSALVELVRELAESGFLAEPPEEGPSEVVDFSGEAPPVDRFYGREEELEIISKALAEAPVVVVTGLAGIGKSTLAAKIVETRRGDTSLFWREVRPWDTASDLGLRLGAFLRALGRPGLHDHLLSGGALDLNRVEEVLTGDLAGIPALLVFDDVHDASTEALAFFAMMLRALKRSNGDATALFLSRSRPGFYGAAEADLETELREIPLGGLSEETSYAFLADQGMPGDVASSLVPVSGGSPLFLKLLAKASETGGVEGARESLEAHIAGEIEPALGEGEREILQIASFYAAPAPSEALLLGARGEARDLIGLEAKNILNRHPDGRLGLHNFLRGYFGKSLPFDRRTGLSSRAATWLAEESERLAREGRIAESITILENAVAIEPDQASRATYSGELGHLRGAVGDREGALEAYRLALDGKPDSWERAIFHAYIAFNLRLLARLEEGKKEVERGLALLEPGPSPGVAFLLLQKANFAMWTGKIEEASEMIDEVGRMLSKLPRNPELLYWWTERMTYVKLLRRPSPGAYREAARWVRDAIELYEGEELPLRTRYYVQSYGTAAWVSFLLGRMDEALSFLDRGRADLETSGGVIERGNHLNLRGYVLSEGLGRFEEAENLYNEAFRWMTATNQKIRTVWFPYMFARLYQRQGRNEDALESLAFFLAKGADVLDAPYLLDAHALMARLAVASGDADAADAHLSGAEALLEESPSDSDLFSVAWARGVVMSTHGEEEEARRSFAEALALDPPPFRGFIYQQLIVAEVLRGEFLLDYGRFLTSIGETEEATELLREALEDAGKGSRAPLEAAIEAELSALQAA